MAETAVVIKYQLLTPDAAVTLLFSTATDGEMVYWVTYETDHINGYGDLVEFVEEWASTKIIEVAKPLVPIENAPPVVRTDEPYFTFLLQVEKPAGLGFWSDHFMVSSDAEIDEKMAEFDEAAREDAKRILTENKKPVAVYVNENGDVEMFFGLKGKIK